VAKEIIKDIKAREALGKGVDILANAVRVTLVPKVVMFFWRRNTVYPLLQTME